MSPARVDIVYTPTTGGDGGDPSGGGGGTARSDTVRPRLTAFALTPRTFTAANTGPAVLAAVGGRVVYRLSEAATVRFTVERVLPGRRRGSRCVATGRGKRCTRYVAVRGSFTQAGTVGVNTFRFMGRLRGRALKPGDYRLVGVARDASRNRAAPARTRFRIA